MVNKGVITNYRKFHIPGHSNHHSIKRDAIFVSNSNTVKHELAKCLGAIMLQRYNDLKFNEEIIKALTLIDDEVNKFGFCKSPSSFLTEACPNIKPERRVDLVNLTDATRYEFESLKSEKKPDSKDGTLTIITYS